MNLAVSLKEKAYASLKELIIKGIIKSGDYFTERSLVERLEMSRTPIRAALERLDVEGLVHFTPNKGVAIAELSIRRAVDFFDIREALETHIVRKLAAGILIEEDIAWFRSNLGQQKQCVDNNDYEEFTLLDSAFHYKLAEIHANSEIIQSMENLQMKLYQIALSVLRKDAARIQVSFHDHQRIFESILAGKAEEAVQAMIEHLQFGKKILVM